MIRMDIHLIFFCFPCSPVQVYGAGALNRHGTFENMSMPCGRRVSRKMQMSWRECGWWSRTRKSIPKATTTYILSALMSGQRVSVTLLCLLACLHIISSTLFCLRFLGWLTACLICWLATTVLNPKPVLPCFACALIVKRWATTCKKIRSRSSGPTDKLLTLTWSIVAGSLVPMTRSWERCQTARGSSLRRYPFLPREYSVMYRNPLLEAVPTSERRVRQKNKSVNAKKKNNNNNNTSEV